MPWSARLPDGYQETGENLLFVIARFDSVVSAVACQYLKEKECDGGEKERIWRFDADSIKLEHIRKIIGVELSPPEPFPVK